MENYFQLFSNILTKNGWFHMILANWRREKLSKWKIWVGGPVKHGFLFFMALLKCVEYNSSRSGHDLYIDPGRKNGLWFKWVMVCQLNFAFIHDYSHCTETVLKQYVFPKGLRHSQQIAPEGSMNIWMSSPSLQNWGSNILFSHTNSTTMSDCAL